MYDLVVVGAGPAGSSAARAAAREGLDVLLLDKEHFPRYKPCGGALSERAISCLDFPLPSEVAERDIYGARFHYQGQAVEVHKSHRLTILTTRSAFDWALLQKAEDAGAETALGCKVRGYRALDDRVEVMAEKGTMEARYLVVASGCQSPLGKHVREKDHKGQFGICMVTEVPEDDGVVGSYLPDLLDIHLGVASHGYGWIFPHRGYYSVGIGGLASRLKDAKGVMAKFLKDNGFEGEYKLKGHLMPYGGWGRRLAKGRVLLAGDSAGLVDPFTGEGIAYALRSGQIASAAVAEKLSDDGMDLERAYYHRCRAEFGGDLSYALLLSRILYSQPDLFLRVLTSEKAYMDSYVDVVSQRASYKSYLWWMLPRIFRRMLPF